MLDNAFESLYLAFFIIGSVVRAIGVAKGKKWWRNKSDIIENRETWTEKLLLFFIFLGMQVIPLVYIFSSLLDFADYDLSLLLSRVLGWAGCVFFCCGHMGTMALTGHAPSKLDCGLEYGGDILAVFFLSGLPGRTHDV